MNLWRLEWLRLLRTRRLLAILAVYLFFGLTGPPTARYLGQLIEGLNSTEGVAITLPPPVPADGIAQYVSNTTQVGLLVVVLVAASALAFDARREMAVFLRTRVAHVRAIVLPAYMVNAGAAIAGLVAGTLAAWYETAVLLGPLSVVGLLAGTAFGALFLAFCVAVVAFAASLLRSVLATAGVTLVALLAMAILGGVTGRGRWLPTGLASAVADLVRDGQIADYLPAAGVTAALTVVLLSAAIAIGVRREI